MKPPIEFKNPKTTTISRDDNPELVNKVEELCISFWEEANSELIDNNHIKNESQVLNCLISTFINFLHITYGSSNSLIILNELSRYIRNSEQYKEEIEQQSGSILNFPPRT